MIGNHKAIIKKQMKSKSEYGSDIVTWEDSGRIYGFLDRLVMTKSEVAGKIVEDSTHIFIAQTMADIGQGDRLEIGDRTYEVNFADNPLMLDMHLEIELKPILQQNNTSQSVIYYGDIQSLDVKEMDVLSLNKEGFKEKVFSKYIDISKENFVIAYPKSFGKSSIRLNNKVVTNWNIKEIMVNGVIHYVYSTSVTGDKLNIELY